MAVCKRVMLLSLALAVMLAHGASPQQDDYALPAAGTYMLPVLGKAADGELVLADGARQGLTSLRKGRVVLLSFIYTRCTDANGCPLASSVLKQALTRLHAAVPPKHVRGITVSFDTQSDAPETMRRYAQQFDGDSSLDWIFAVGADAVSTQQLLHAYGQIAEADPVTTDASPRFSHMLRVYLIDQAGNIRNVYGNSLLSVEALVNDVKTVLSPSTRASNLQKDSGRLDLLALARNRPKGFPVPRLPADNPLTSRKIALGRKLFFDRRLSGNGTISCANCHVPEQGFANNEMATAVGVEGRSVRRNAPTLLDIAYFNVLFHDGREMSLETQVWSPLLAHSEMAAPSVGWVVDRISHLPDYRGQFEQTFGRAVSMETLGRAIASYERTLRAGESAFDRWHYRGEESALSPEAKRGYALFAGKAGCSSCHVLGEKYALFTDQQFHSTGLGWARTMAPQKGVDHVPLAPGVSQNLDMQTLHPFVTASTNDLGRYEITLDPADRWAFRTPSLRNVSLTAPYMHDGSLPSLDAVVAFYNEGGIVGAPQDARLHPLHLSRTEQAELVVFMQSLTGKYAQQLAIDAQRVPVGNPLD